MCSLGTEPCRSLNQAQPWDIGQEPLAATHSGCLPAPVGGQPRPMETPSGPGEGAGGVVPGALHHGQL